MIAKIDRDFWEREAQQMGIRGGEAGAGGAASSAEASGRTRGWGT